MKKTSKKISDKSVLELVKKNSDQDSYKLVEVCSQIRETYSQCVEIEELKRFVENKQLSVTSFTTTR